MPNSAILIVQDFFFVSFVHITGKEHLFYSFLLLLLLFYFIFPPLPPFIFSFLADFDEPVLDAEAEQTPLCFFLKNSYEPHVTSQLS